MFVQNLMIVVCEVNEQPDYAKIRHLAAILFKNTVYGGVFTRQGEHT